MAFRTRVTAGAGALLVAAFCTAAAAETPPVGTDLVDELHRWIDAATDLPAAGLPATIVFADARDMAEPGEAASMIGSVPRGLYDTESATITLVRPWSAEDPQDVAVLLHELVHHRQRGKHFFCEAAKEHAAYRLQRDWLTERGLALDVNWIGVVLASSCRPRDVHPEPVTAAGN